MRRAPRVATWRAGADPGLLRLRVALRGVLGVSLTAVVLSQLAPWLHLPTLSAMLLGGMLGLHGAVTAAGRPPRDVVRTLLPFPLPVAVGSVTAAALQPVHVAQLIAFAVLLVAAVFIRRYGLRAMAYGLLGYLSFFTTAMLRLPLAAVPDLLIIAVVGTLLTILVSAVLLPDRPMALYLATVESFVRRIRRAAALAADQADGRPTGRLARRRGRRPADALTAAGFRVMEAALLVDGYLTPSWSKELTAAGVATDRATGDPQTRAEVIGTPPTGELVAARTAQARRRQLMDAEGALDDLIAAVRGLPAPDPELAAVIRRLGAGDAVGARAAAVALGDGAHSAGGSVNNAATGAPVAAFSTDPPRGLALAAVVRLVDAVPSGIGPEHEPLSAPQRPPVPDRITGYQPAVDLISGAMPGAKGSAAAAASSVGRGWSLDTRQVVQAAVAAPVVLVLADLLSPTRFGWGMLACLLVLTGTFTAAEVVTKGVHRLVGTVAGMLVATVAVALTGTSPAAVIAVMVVCVFLGLYFFRVSYAVLAFAITTLMGELYNLEGQFSPGLLALRVAETGLGAGIAIAVTFLVVPLRARHAWVAARAAFDQEVAALLLALAGRLDDPEPVGDLLLQQRRVDARAHQLVVVGQPFSGAGLVGGLTVFRPRAGLLDAIRVATRTRRVTLLVVRSVPGSRPDVAARLATLDDPGGPVGSPATGEPTTTPDVLTGAVDLLADALIRFDGPAQPADTPDSARRTAPSARSRT
ncbi:FUSC family protein [Nakamurella flava]|uniref:FUSC family protein n=1 Tax=Nakamurella flava TaxID=2576308 RepID=A0A4U6QKC2_9ACTN|nr:FUSC family protein [Nakamurella flava]TKV60709.1 FUSC family protein [Nakamurella flava]